MNLADDRLEELDNLPRTASEGVLSRCRAAADFIHKGQHEAAREVLGDLWLGVGQRPPVSGLPPAIEAEALLQCGTLTGWLGSVRNVSGAQEQAKDMLSEAARVFDSQAMPAKVSEAQYELGICYWRLGAFEEARLILGEALKLLKEPDAELKAKVHIRRTLVEISENRYNEALNILQEAEPVFESANDGLKGRWHGQKAIILLKLAATERRPDYADRAIIEFTAAIFHYEQARHERYCALNLNNLAFLLYKLGRYRDAHEHLNRARLIFTNLRDTGNVAQVDETRARVLVAEKRYREAEHIMPGVIKTLERSGEAALLADALTVQGVVWARLGAHEDSLDILRRAMEVAQDSGALTQAGHAALTLIEEHGAARMLPESELTKTYRRAHDLLKGSQDAEDKERLLACALVVIQRLAGAQPYSGNFSFYDAVHELEARLLEQALELEDGSVTRAAERLGLKRQALANMLKARHKQLSGKRTPPTPRRRSIIKKDS
ncbi:MAG TPA: helix-turn-helix domain-containing protein [Pyrinomonadaceae bacterium]|jgi:tetratricopeptide (TPR) repeat protein